MNQQTARLLRNKAVEVALNFSRPDRGGNPAAEVFQVDRTVVLSEVTAAVIFHKSSGKKAVAFFYYINSRAAPRWEYFFITYTHLTCLDRVKELLFDVEQHNYAVSVEELENAPPTQRRLEAI